MNIVVGIACLVVVAVLEGVTGFPDKQLANENQIEENDKLSILQDDEIDRQEKGSLDRPACRIFDGQCQNINDHCAGEMRTGSLWCRNSRRFGCCIPPPPISYTLDCEIDGRVYPNGHVAEDRCIILFCNNGTWEYYDWNDDCGACYTYGKTTIYPYVTHNISGSLISHYNINEDDGTYIFSQDGRSSPAQLGIDITLEFTNEYHNETCVTDVLYNEPGITVEICFYDGYPIIIVNEYEYTFTGSYYTAIPIYATFGTVYISFTDYGICIVGSQGLSVCVDHHNYGYAYNVYALATPSLHDQLYGLCDVFPAVVRTYPCDWRMPVGNTTNIAAFIPSWELGGRRSTLTNKYRGNPSRDQTLQDTDRPIFEMSLNEIEKICEEMHKGPCTVLPSEECETLKETCVSVMSNAGIPGKRGLSESSE